MLHTVCETTQYLRETIQYLRNDTVFSRNDLRNDTVFARETIARNDTVFAKRHSIFEKLLRNDTIFARNDLRNDTVVASERYCICLRERHRICERAILYLREKPFLRYRSYRCLPRLSSTKQCRRKLISSELCSLNICFNKFRIHDYCKCDVRNRLYSRCTYIYTCTVHSIYSALYTHVL